MSDDTVNPFNQLAVLACNYVAARSVEAYAVATGADEAAQRALHTVKDREAVALIHFARSIKLASDPVLALPTNGMKS